MKQVKAAVRDDKVPTTGAHGGAPSRELVPRDDFLLEIHPANFEGSAAQLATEE